MAMRVGSSGPPMWDQCFAEGVAAITYDGIGDTDFSNLSLKEARERISHLSSSQKSSLIALAYEMRAGDTIYVKDGGTIIAKGIVKGVPNVRAYKFNFARPEIRREEDGSPWFQQIPVSWISDFPSVQIRIGTNQLYTIQEISLEEIDKIERRAFTASSHLQSGSAEEDSERSTEAYLRASIGYRKIIERRHDALSNAFKRWIKKKLGSRAIQERRCVDVQFAIGAHQVLAELKVCAGLSTRFAIREALGQLLEYNYYPTRSPYDVWLIVIDKIPSAKDFHYIDMLRSKLELPLFVGWGSDDFEFYPAWPNS